MSLENSTLTLSGETREIKSLDFYKLGQVGKTDGKGETTVVVGEYTFLVTKSSLRYRHKPKGSKTSSPIKTVRKFAELDKLDLGQVPAVEVENQNNSAESTEEEISMAKINVGGKQIEIPAAVEKIMKANGFKGEVAELPDLDKAIASATGKDLETLTAFDDKINAEAQAKVEDKGAAPQTGLAGSNLFGTQGGTETTETKSGTRRVKTDAEREADKRAREAKRESDVAQIKANIGQIENLRAANAEIEGATEAIESLKKMMLIDGKLPLFKTLVPSDTRLAANVKNLVKPADRVYHKSLQNKPEFRKTGKDIESKYAAGEFEVTLRESSPAQPSGYFVYIPEALMNFAPSRLSLFSEREAVVNASESGNTNLVIKFYPKSEIIPLLVLLDAEMVEYDLRTKRYVDAAPHTYFTSRQDETHNVPVFSLRAKDSDGRSTKLSIRNFLPLATHNTVRTTAKDFDLELTTAAFFKRVLMNVPEGAPANKYSQLTPESALKFSLTDKGELLFNNFSDKELVQAYDSTANRPHEVEMPLPLVVLSTPTTQGAVARPVFSKSKHSDAGYNPIYKAARDAVGDQINKPRKQTTKSILTAHTEEIARVNVIHGLLTGEQIIVK